MIGPTQAHPHTAGQGVEAQLMIIRISRRTVKGPGLSASKS